MSGDPSPGEPNPGGDVPAQAIAIAVVIDGPTVLIGQRPSGVPLAGYFEFPGGKIHPDEAPRDAAIRECREETGLTVVAFERLAVVQHSYAHGQLTLTFFRCEPVGPVEPRPPFAWVPRARLEEYRFPPANAPVIKMLVRGE